MRDAGKSNLPLNLPSEAVQALAAAGHALLAFASAVQGNAPFDPSKASASLTLSALPSALFGGNATVNEAANELLRVKLRAGRADDYLKNLRGHLVRFSRGVGNAPLAEIHTGRIEKFLDGLDVNGRTRKGYLDSVRLLFNFALRRGYVAGNPALVIELPPDGSRVAPVVIHSPAQVARVLDVTRQADANACRFLAIRHFAGLRASEAQKCVVNLERGFIEVPAAVAKTRRRRLVTIQPVLAEWLKLPGALPVRDLHTRLARVAARAGVPWHRGVTRHSFCSYHLAQFQNAGKTALEAGHSEAMLFAHYRELVTGQDAAAFWELTPERAAALCAPSPDSTINKHAP